MAIPRSIAQLTLTHPLSDGVLHAVDLLQTQYGATSYRDSGHKDTAPTWIFELTDFGAEVGLRMNGGVLTLYMRNRTLGGQTLTDWLSPEKVAKVYPRDGSPAGSIKRSTYLSPSPDNECVMLRLERNDLRPLFDYFFDLTETSTPPEEEASEGVSSDDGRMAHPIDEDSFQALLERRSELGRVGERIAFEDEVHRLKGLGCPDPCNWVKLVAQDDVGRGYDIESSWHGHERCIEVKSSTSTQSSLFLSNNERLVLTDLAERGWIYRVLVAADGSGEVLTRLQNPMSVIPASALKPVLFRISPAALS